MCQNELNMDLHLNLTQDIGHGITLIFICFIVVFLATILDLIVALVGEYKIGHSIESRKLRKTVIKIILYYSVLLYGVLIDVVGLAFVWYDLPYAALLAGIGCVGIEGKSMWETHDKICSSVTELPEILREIISATTIKDAAKVVEILKNRDNEQKDKQGFEK